MILTSFLTPYNALLLCFFLWMEYCTKCEFSAKFIMQFPAKLWSELGTTIEDNRKGNPMKPHYLFHINCSQLFSVIINSYWNKEGLLSHSINNFPNSIKLPRGFGKPTTKSISILSYFYSKIGIICTKPAGLWCSYFNYCNFWHFATNSDIVFHARPPINSFKISIHLSHCWMNRLPQTMRLSIKPSTLGTHILSLTLSTQATTCVVLVT